MDKDKQGSQNMPDFDKLSDRMIAEPTDSPTFVMKTNLDPKDPTEDNPYFNEKNKQQTEEFCDYFGEE
ncbi:hypothetical protein [Alkalihalobacterium chitinilyticum]|uniref:Uncharacterized protein n=1 Tax=Alkalihalobacterium chitinilyticum TaxID=2980103 RepID=A0ABT5VDI6_9BACI|nr:hypothetical protein [Alkalihalobacterium chitinilyticum]MDE5413525.1 hypothetical protein [Alkalihalobacterium chitinilyticum]